MPKIERVSSSEDDDIWEYRSRNSQADKCHKKSEVKSQAIRRRKIKSEVANTAFKSQGNSCKRKTGKITVKKEVVDETTPEKKPCVDRSGRCPVCQMPFSILSMVETPSWHVDQCLDVPYSSKKECARGLDCNSEIASHYKKFRHTLLARSHRKNSTNGSQRELGNVNNAKVKLSFDSNEEIEQSFCSSRDCFIELTSGSESPDDDALRVNESVRGEEISKPVIDLDLASNEDLSGDETYTARKLHPVQSIVCTKNINTNDSMKTEQFILKQDLKSQTLSTVVKEKSSLREVDSYDSDIIELPDILVDDEKNGNDDDDDNEDFIKVEAVDLISVDSSDSSIYDIDDIMDKSREVSDMIEDVLSNDTVPGIKSSSKQTVETRTEAKLFDNSEEDLFESSEEYAHNDTHDDPVESLIGDKNVVRSAISSLRETPAKSLSDSESSMDWELLKSTLTPSTIFRCNDFDLNSSSSFCDSKYQTNRNAFNGKICHEEVNEPTDEPVQPKMNKDKKLQVHLTRFKDSNSHKNTLTSLNVHENIKHKNINVRVGSSFDNPSECSGIEQDNAADIEPKLNAAPGFVPNIGESVKHSRKRSAPTNGTKVTADHDVKKPKVDTNLMEKRSNNITKKKKRLKRGQNVLKTAPKSVASFFFPSKTPVTIATDDESSGDCDQFCRDRPCCDNCSAEKRMVKKQSMKKLGTPEDKFVPESAALNLKTSKTPVAIVTDDESSIDCSQFQNDGQCLHNCSKENGCLPQKQASKELGVFEGNLLNSHEKPSKQTHLSSISLPGNSGDNLKATGYCFMNHEKEQAVNENSSSQNLDIVEHSQSSSVPSIQNVCTESQTSYLNLPGGFICTDDFETTEANVNNTKSGRDTLNQQNSESNASQGDSMVQSIVKIQRSATEILMQSAKLLNQKRKNQTNSYLKDVGNVITKSVNDVLMQQRPGSSNSKASQSTAESQQKKSRGWTHKNSSLGSDISRDSKDGKRNEKRKCPFYKKIPGTVFTVDAFRYGDIPDCKAYILSHFHYDHYGGLNRDFQNQIYCSQTTGNLVRKKIGVASKFIHTIPLNTPTFIENVEITFLEANHCPGSVLILFKLKSGKVFLHTGDFRACREMELYPELQNLSVNCLYLDTTYCDPLYDFPPQNDVIKFTVKLALDTLASNPKTLIVCGSYTIGKERIFMAIAQALNCKVCVTRDKSTVLNCIEDTDWKQRLSLNWEDSGVHVLQMNKVNVKGLQEHLSLHGKKYTSVLGIEPTGWTHSKKVLSLHHIKPKLKKDNITIYGVPYSEHSSFLELKRFYQFLKPDKVLPTVNNGNVHSRRKMEVIFEAWSEDTTHKQKNVEEQRSLKDWMK